MLGVLLLVLAPTAAQEKPEPKVPVGKETTYITEPLTKEGYIDYVAALNERLSKGITPERNANVLIWQALGPKPEGGNGMPAEFFRWLGIAEPPATGDYFVSLNRYLKAELKKEPGEVVAAEEELYKVASRPWSAKAHPHLAGWLKANDKPLARMVEASKRPDYYNPLVPRGTEARPGELLGVLLPSVQKCRETAFALQARALLRAHEGRVDEAWQDLLACHRLGRLVARGGTLIEMLVGIAIDAIASNAELAFLDVAGKDAKQVRGWLRDLQGLPAMPAMADKLDLAERFTFLDTVQLVRRQGFGALAALAGEPGKKLPGPEAGLTAAVCEPALRNGNRLFDRMVATARIQDRTDRVREWQRIEQELRAMRLAAAVPVDTLREAFSGVSAEKIVARRVNDTVVSLMIPAFFRLDQSSDRAEQTQRNLHVAFALVAYRLEKGGYPESLEALAPAYLPSVPDDLFAGAALVYRKTDSGFLLYSVGLDGRDDEGRGRDDDPPGDDLSVRLPLSPMKR